MARTVTVKTRAGESTILVGDDGEVGEVQFERLLEANPEWSVVEAPKAKRTKGDDA